MNIITVENRSVTAKAKQLRKASIVPCVIYGGSLPESLLVQIDHSAARKLLRSKREGSKMEISLDGKTIPVQIKDIDCNFTTNEIMHISFQALEADKRVNSKAQFILENPDKVTGVLEQLLFEVSYSALPEDMIDTVSIDLEELVTGSVVTLADIPAFQNENVTMQLSLDSVILKISDKKRAVAEKVEEEAS